MLFMKYVRGEFAQSKLIQPEKIPMHMALLSHKTWTPEETITTYLATYFTINGLPSWNMVSRSLTTSITVYRETSWFNSDLQ